MPYICCTRNLAKELNIELLVPAPDVRGFLGWHGNVVSLFHRKFVLLTNDSTRFTLFIPGMIEKDFARFEAVFPSFFERALAYLYDDAVQIAKARLLFGGFSCHKTQNRSVLGMMTDAQSNIEYMLRRELERLPKTVAERRWVTFAINTTPRCGRDIEGYTYPAEAMIKMIDRARV